LKKAVLFVDHHNSVGSQIAEAYLNQFYGDRYEAYSAGLVPTRVNPYLYLAMIEERIDISGAFSKSIDHFKGLDTDFKKDVNLSSFFPEGEFIETCFKGAYVNRKSDDDTMAEIMEIKPEIKQWINDTFGA
jgi:arsenate reductase